MRTKPEVSRIRHRSSAKQNGGKGPVQNFVDNDVPVHVLGHK